MVEESCAEWTGWAGSSLILALNRLTADQALHEWLEWPTNVYATLPKGALLLVCRANGWARQQLLRAFCWQH